MSEQELSRKPVKLRGDYMTVGELTQCMQEKFSTAQVVIARTHRIISDELETVRCEKHQALKPLHVRCSVCHYSWDVCRARIERNSDADEKQNKDCLLGGVRQYRPRDLVRVFIDHFRPCQGLIKDYGTNTHRHVMACLEELHM